MTMYPAVPGGAPVSFTLTLASKTLIVPANAVFFLDRWFAVATTDANVATRIVTIQFENSGGDPLQMFFRGSMTATQQRRYQFGSSYAPNDVPASLQGSLLGPGGGFMMTGLTRLAIDWTNEQAADTFVLDGQYRIGPVTLPT